MHPSCYKVPTSNNFPNTCEIADCNFRYKFKEMGGPSRTAYNGSSDQGGGNRWNSFQVNQAERMKTIIICRIKLVQSQRSVHSPASSQRSTSQRSQRSNTGQRSSSRQLSSQSAWLSSWWYIRWWRWRWCTNAQKSNNSNLQKIRWMIKI